MATATGLVNPLSPLAAMSNDMVTERLLLLNTYLNYFVKYPVRSVPVGVRFIRSAKKIWYQIVIFKKLDADSHRNTE